MHRYIGIVFFGLLVLGCSNGGQTDELMDPKAGQPGISDSGQPSRPDAGQTPQTDSSQQSGPDAGQTSQTDSSQHSDSEAGQPTGAFPQTGPIEKRFQLLTSSLTRDDQGGRERHGSGSRHRGRNELVFDSSGGQRRSSFYLSNT